MPDNQSTVLLYLLAILLDHAIHKSHFRYENVLNYRHKNLHKPLSLLAVHNTILLK